MLYKQQQQQSTISESTAAPSEMTINPSTANNIIINPSAAATTENATPGKTRTMPIYYLIFLLFKYQVAKVK